MFTDSVSVALGEVAREETAELSAEGSSNGDAVRCVGPPKLNPTLATASPPGFEGFGPNRLGKGFDVVEESSLAGGVAAVTLTTGPSLLGVLNLSGFPR